MKIPFDFMPASWGLKGKSYRLARAEYELEPGEDLERTLLRIRHDVPDDFNPESELPIEFMKDYLYLDMKYGKITKSEYEKNVATLYGKPHVQVMDSGFDAHEGPGGFWMEFDWNEQFIDFLRESGYTGFDDQEIFDKWLSDIYRSQILESEMGENETEETPDEVIVTEHYRPDGKIEYK